MQMARTIRTTRKKKGSRKLYSADFGNSCYSEMHIERDGCIRNTRSEFRLFPVSGGSDNNS
jgi:hypothetical protein